MTQHSGYEVLLWKFVYCLSLLKPPFSEICLISIFRGMGLETKTIISYTSQTIL